MKKLNNKGFGAVEIILVFVIIGLVGGVGYYVYNNQANKDTQQNVSNLPANEESQTDKETKKLAEIRTKLNELNHRGEGDGYFEAKSTDPKFRVSYSNNFDFTFNASVYATDENISPVGSQGPNGSGKDQAIDRNKVDEIMKAAGLNYASTDGNEPNVTIRYEGDLVFCNLTDSMGVAHVTCSAKQEVDEILGETKKAYQVLKTEQPDYDYSSNELFISYVESSDGTVRTVKIDTNQLEYLASVDGVWSYLGAMTDTQSGEFESKLGSYCEVIGDPKYKDAFYNKITNKPPC